ncbi:50S ribosomal protein L29 [Methylococcus sp. EFPC2]|uniref:50S ribosomal protein L29 n=1 Tax=Methylococcus sp. EFPC2 TaxID=2812648 RepID=UPI001F081A79|nr:50S ribosomal protein L29 [Methylococcus sp. EFPC2]
MKATELRQKTVEELDTVLSDLYKEQFNLQMQKATGQLGKPDRIKKVRRDIARVNTVKAERGLAV